MIRLTKDQLKEVQLTNEQRVQLVAVNSMGSIIKHIENPIEEIQIMAVRQDPNAIQYIKNPSDTVLQEALSNKARLNK